MPKKDKKTKSIVVRLTREQYNAIAKEAIENEVSLSNVILARFGLAGTYVNKSHRKPTLCKLPESKCDTPS